MATIALRTTTTFPAETPRTASVGTPEYAKTDPTPYLLPATRVHPIAIAIPLLAYAWLGVAAWLAFAGGETSLILAVLFVLSVMYFGLLVGGAVMGRNMTPERQQDRSVREFLDGEVEIATGRITGREAMMQIAMMPVALAIGGTAIILCAVWAGI